MEKSIKTENNRKKGFKKLRIKEIIKAELKIILRNRYKFWETFCFPKFF